MQINSNFRISLTRPAQMHLVGWNVAGERTQRIQHVFGETKKKKTKKGIYAKFIIQSSDAHILHSFQITSSSNDRLHKFW